MKPKYSNLRKVVKEYGIECGIVLRKEIKDGKLIENELGNFYEVHIGIDGNEFSGSVISDQHPCAPEILFSIVSQFLNNEKDSFGVRFMHQIDKEVAVELCRAVCQDIASEALNLK